MERGFSLFECLIVLVIISILAGMLYPSYQAHIAKVHRQRAEITLWEMAHRAQEQFVRSGRYDNLQLEQLLPSAWKDDYYQYAIEAQGERDFRITATPNDAQVGRYFPGCAIQGITSQGLTCYAR